LNLKSILNFFFGLYLKSSYLTTKYFYGITLYPTLTPKYYILLPKYKSLLKKSTKESFGGYMARCIKCSSFLGDDVSVCPICGAGQPSESDDKVDNVDTTLSNSPSFLTNEASDNEYIDKRTEIKRLSLRGEECFNSGKAWLGAKNRKRARKDFQRAFNYYETILKMDPNNEKARDARSKCLFKMA
jgi:hypothetical protein